MFNKQFKPAFTYASLMRASVTAQTQSLKAPLNNKPVLLITRSYEGYKDKDKVTSTYTYIDGKTFACNQLVP